jgi:ketosteroid isomerase-like protein
MRQRIISDWTPGGACCNDAPMDAAANKELISDFYAAFGRRDGDAMAAAYAPDAHFWDPAFHDLNGAEPGEMWRMLTSRAEDLKIELLAHDATDSGGTANWKATYTFTQTGRKVVNNVEAEFIIVDGKIKDHHDEFSFYKWSMQALGLPGLLLGWTPIISGAVNKKARAGLDEFMES